jgi:hypothetical protein
MFEIDHIPVWTRDRDGILQRLSEATGLPILEGFAPDGRRAARGLRFSNGPFIDVHQADGEGPAFLGLSGDVAGGDSLAERQGWWTRTEARRDEPDAAPWSILSFRRGQGVLSSMFVIQYSDDPSAWTSPIFNGGLYHQPASQGVALRRVWLTAADTEQAGEALQALGFVPGGEARSSVAPGTGWTYRGGRADIVVATGDDAVVRFDVDGDGPLQIVEIGPRLTAVVGRDPAESQQG